jgi:uncharacterized protein (TIGR00251 family)
VPPAVSPISALPGRVRLAVRLTPKASRARILGLAEEADGARVLKVAVSAPPEDGKANAALVELLARALKVPRGAVSIAAGAASRRKLVDIEGDAEALRPRLSALLGEDDAHG